MRYKVYIATPLRQEVLLRSLQIRKKIGEPTSTGGKHFTDGPGGKVLMGASAGSKSGTYPYTASTSFGYTPTIWNVI